MSTLTFSAALAPVCSPVSTMSGVPWLFSLMVMSKPEASTVSFTLLPRVSSYLIPQITSTCGSILLTNSLNSRASRALNLCSASRE